MASGGTSDGGGWSGRRPLSSVAHLVFAGGRPFSLLSWRRTGVVVVARAHRLAVSLLFLRIGGAGARMRYHNSQASGRTIEHGEARSASRPGATSQMVLRHATPSCRPWRVTAYCGRQRSSMGSERQRVHRSVGQAGSLCTPVALPQRAR